MARIKRVSLNRFSRLLKDMPEEVGAAVERGLYSAAQRGVGEVVSQIDGAKPYPAVNTGGLRQSVSASKVGRDSFLSVDAPHAAIIEDGTRPFYPPLQPLFEWVIRKGMAGDEDEGLEIARAIQQTIAERGIQPRHYFRKSMKTVRDTFIPAEVESELKKL